MRTEEEVRDLLEEAAAGIAEPDLADASWTRGRSIRRRRRRRTAVAAAAVVVAVVAAAVLTGPPGGRGDPPVGPTQSRSAPQTVPSTGTVSGMPYWVAPAPGGERFLNRLDTPLGDQLTPPEGKLDDMGVKPVIKVAAVALRQVPGTERFRPAILSTFGRWAETRVELEMTKDAEGNKSPPLDATAVSRNGERIAFPQPKHVVVLDATTGEIRPIPVPSATIENVAWMPTGDAVLASGDGVAYLVPVDQGETTPAAAAQDPLAVTAPFALDVDGNTQVLTRYDATGQRKVERYLSVPVAQWYGQSFAAGALVARSFFSEPVRELAGRTVSEAPQMIAVVETGASAAGKLLILDDRADTTHRFKGCCSVLGWYDDHTVLLESRSGSHSWILGWDIRTGELRRVTELMVDAVALGPILR